MWVIILTSPPSHARYNDSTDWKCLNRKQSFKGVCWGKMFQKSELMSLIKNNMIKGSGIECLEKKTSTKTSSLRVLKCNLERHFTDWELVLTSLSVTLFCQISDCWSEVEMETRRLKRGSGNRVRNFVFSAGNAVVKRGWCKTTDSETELTKWRQVSWTAHI